MGNQFPTLEEAAKISAAPKKPETNKPIEKESKKLMTPHLNSFMNTKKDYTKPFFKELESDRGNIRRNEHKPRYNYRKSHDLKVSCILTIVL